MLDARDSRPTLARRLLRPAALTGLALCVLAAALLWAAGWPQWPGPRAGVIRDYGAGAAPRLDAGRLVVMSWNIAYARGLEPQNQANAAGSRAEMEQRLRGMGALIRERGADLVLLQEVDFGSKRSHYLDQAALLAAHSGLRYAAGAVSWDANYVPFPYWPPSRHYGRVLSGGAVLSRFPIEQNHVVLLEKPDSNPWWYNLFYLFRYTQQVKLRLGPGRAVWVVNNHLEAWDKTNRAGQARRVVLEVQARRGRGGGVVWAVGGDLNTVPPEARRKHGFVDEPRDDYRDDDTLGILRGLAGLVEVVPLQRYVDDEATHFTFPCLAPTRRLDYLFVDRSMRVARYEMIRTGAFSDHLPLLAELTTAEPDVGRTPHDKIRNKISR